MDPKILDCPESSFRFLRDHIENLFTEKPETFWKDGVFKLRERWRKVVKQNGAYIIQ